jgi:ankyrin repeat protein
MTMPARRQRQNIHMKKVYVLLAGVLMAAAAQLRAADALTEALQKGLFEEEANQNLDAAIKAYQDVIGRADDQRRVAATAVFRLAECYRKQGKTNEATGEYRRLLRDYADQTTLVNLSRQNLTGLGATPATVVGAADLAAVGSTDEEEREIRRIKALIKDSPDLINARNQEIYRSGSENARVIYGTVLHQAAYKGHLQVASYLLGNGSDPNARSSEEFAPLFYAAQNGHRNMAELLLTKGADPNVGASTSYRGTPLHAASSKGFRAVAEVLLGHKADVNAPDGSGKTPLHAAVEAGFLPVAELLIGRGANIDALYAVPWDAQRGASQLTRIELYDGTPLHFAVQRTNPEMTQFLLAKGANVEARSGAGLTPLHYAAYRGHSVIAGLLLQRKADVNAQGSSDSRFSGWTPLHMAIFHRATNLVSLLLEKGADPNAATDNKAASDYRTALHNAIEYTYRPGVELLLKYKADVNGEDFPGNTPLLRATRKNDAAIVELLLAHDADVKVTDTNGNTALVLAVQNDFVRTAELLLAKGADANARDAAGNSLLAIAMGSRSQNQPPIVRPVRNLALEGSGGKPQPVGTKTMVELLLDYKIDVNAPLAGEASITPLQHAIAYKATNWVRLLLERGANPNVPYSGPGRTLLHLAVEQQLVVFADLLLRHGADVNGMDDSGETPLFRAINVNHTNIVDLLLRHNADLTVVNNDGTTPLLRAVEAGNVTISEQLLVKGANPNAINNEGQAALHIALGARQPQNPSRVVNFGGVSSYNPQAFAAAPPASGIPSRSIKVEHPGGKAASPATSRSMVKVLLDYKADPNLRDKQGNIPLSLAIQKTNEEAAEQLLAYKADPQGTDPKGNTALHFATKSGYVAAMDLLLAHKADPNAKNMEGFTPLHLAVTSAGTNLVALLLDKGGDVNACDNHGDTPLHKALRAVSGNSEQKPAMLRILLDRAADVTKRCDGQPSPFELARVRNNSQVELLREYHPKKLARVDVSGPVGERLWYWEANQKQTLSQVMAAVGLTERANPRQIRILRDDPETRLKRELQFDLEAIREKRVPDAPVQDKDKIIVAER